MKKNARHVPKLTLYRPAPRPVLMPDRVLDRITLIVSGMGFACALAFLSALR